MALTVPAGAAMNRVDYDVAMEVAAHEALVRQAYRDSAGILTWCIGMTDATGHLVERYLGKPASYQHCMNVYAWALRNYCQQVVDVFRGYPLTQAQFAAACSFHWNTGAIKTASWVQHVRAGNMAAAEKSFKNWNKAGEKVAAGLKTRREREWKLWTTGKWSHDGTMVEYTRVRPNLQPDFSSGRRVNVEKELRAAIEALYMPALDQAPKPDAKPAAPTLTPPEPVSAPSPQPWPPRAAGGARPGLLVSIVAGLTAAAAFIINLPCSWLGVFCGG